MEDDGRNCLLFALSWSSWSSVQNSSGVMTKTMEVCIHKEGNSFGFVMRGTWRCELTASKRRTRLLLSVIFFFFFFFQAASMRTGAGLAPWWSHTWGPEVLLTGEDWHDRHFVKYVVFFLFLKKASSLSAEKSLICQTATSEWWCAQHVRIKPVLSPLRETDCGWLRLAQRLCYLQSKKKE